MNILKLEDILYKVQDDICKDMYIYDIKDGTREHLKITIHHTLRNIFENKQHNNQFKVVITDIQKKLPQSIKQKYIKFFKDINSILPNLVIQELQLDSTFNKIIMNKFQKARCKDENFRKLKQLSERYGLLEINHRYLENPSAFYKIII